MVLIRSERALGTAGGAEPNTGHRALVDLDKSGRLINAQETPYDRLADAIVREPIGEVLPTLCQRLVDGEFQACGL